MTLDIEDPTGRAVLPAAVSWAAKQITLAAYLLPNPHMGLLKIHQRYGRNVTAFVGPLKTTFLFGAEANEAVLATHAAKMLWRDGVKAIMPLAGESAFGVCDGDLYTILRSSVDPAFTRSRLDAYVPLILDEAERFLRSFRVGERVELHGRFQSAVRRTIVRCLLGETLAEESEAIGKSFAPGFAYMNTRRALFQWNIPGSAYSRVMKSRRSADRLILEEISRRRRDATGSDETVLDMLISSPHCPVEGPLDNGTIRDQAAELLAAGQETTSATLAWLVTLLCQHPSILTNVLDEVHGTTWSDLGESEQWGRRFPYLRACISETLRLYPPVGVTPRRVTEPFEIYGSTVPAGAFVLLSQFVSHRMDEYWTSPDRFVPQRWIPGNPSHHPVHKFTYFPFGLGQRRCIGPALAIRILTVLASTFLANVHFAPARIDSGTKGIITMSPRRGVHVDVTGIVSPARVAA